MAGRGHETVFVDQGGFELGPGALQDRHQAALAHPGETSLLPGLELGRVEDSRHTGRSGGPEHKLRAFEGPEPQQLEGPQCRQLEVHKHRILQVGAARFVLH